MTHYQLVWRPVEMDDRPKAEQSAEGPLVK